MIKYVLLILLSIIGISQLDEGRYTVITNLTSCDYYYHSKTDYGTYDVKVPSNFELLITMNDDTPIRAILEIRDSCISDCDTTYLVLKNSESIIHITGTDRDMYQDLIIPIGVKQYFILPPNCHRI